MLKSNFIMWINYWDSLGVSYSLVICWLVPRETSKSSRTRQWISLFFWIILAVFNAILLKITFLKVMICFSKLVQLFSSCLGHSTKTKIITNYQKKKVFNLQKKKKILNSQISMKIWKGGSKSFLLKWLWGV